MGEIIGKTILRWHIWELFTAVGYSMFKLRCSYTVENSPARETLASKKKMHGSCPSAPVPPITMLAGHTKTCNIVMGDGGAIEFKLQVSRLFLPSMDSDFMK